MKLEVIVSRLLKSTSKKTVVVIDGYSGAGKTTILKKLAAKYSQILPVHHDDFMNTGKKRRALLKATKDKLSVMELEWHNVKKLRQLIKAYRTRNGPYVMKLYNPKTDQYDQKRVFNLSKKVLVLEGVFLLHPRLYQKDFDLKIFLDVNMRAAYIRRIKREKKRWGNKYISEDRPDSFFRLFKLAYRRYVNRYQPKKLADLVIKVY